MLKKLVHRAALASVLASTLIASTAHANLIENGSFEIPDISTVIGKRGSTSSTWQYYDANDVDGFSGSNVELWNSGFNGVNAYEGNQFLELNSHPSSGPNNPFSIFQSFDTSVGETYELSFAYRARKNNNEAFNVNISSTSGSSINTDLTDHETGLWSMFKGLFTATDKKTTLTFTSITPLSHTVGNFIDDVRVVKSVPEIDGAGAGLAFGLLFGLFAIFRERKLKAK